MDFSVVGEVTDIATIARGRGVASRDRLRAKYGMGSWRKLKGSATIELADGTRRRAEIHWYEAHGVGRKEFKIKRFLD